LQTSDSVQRLGYLQATGGVSQRSAKRGLEELPPRCPAKFLKSIESGQENIFQGKRKNQGMLLKMMML